MRRGSSPPKHEQSPQGKLSSSPPRAQDEGEQLATTEDTMKGEMTADGDVSNGGDRVIAVRTTRSTEGEAELPSLDDDPDTKAESLSKDPIGKGKEKEKDDVKNTSPDDTSFLPPRPPPRGPGWGRDPREDIFHVVPQSHGGADWKRAVFREWPRDPNGKLFGINDWPSQGTLSPDGYPWGATLYDFYTVKMFKSDSCHSMTLMTGSAIWETMKKLGELDAAKSEIEWAKSEGKPRVLGVANTEELIVSVEKRLQLRDYYKFSMLDDVRRMALPNRIDGGDEVERAEEDKKKGEHDKEDVVERAPEDDDGDGMDSSDEDHSEEEEEVPEGGDEEQDKSEVEYDDVEVNRASIPPPPTIPVTSPFHPSHYPEPWPFIPFENPLSILLQERIPLDLLPQTLYVHDPFSLLTTRERRFRNTSWMSRPDIIRTYDLCLDEFARERPENGRRRAKLGVLKSRTLIVLRYTRTKEQIENHEPAIEVPLPPPPRRMTKVDEGHLYLSPIAKVGEGNHSIVYRGEWELPRDLFARPKLCQQCFKEAVDREVQRLKDTGRWEKMSKGAVERDGEIVERKITCIVSSNASPSQILQMVDESNVWGTFVKKRNINALQLDFTEDGDEDESTKGSDVATVRIDPPFSYESQKTCTHGSNPFSVPRTTKFTVVAKLSIEYDDHLSAEAYNYQRFPEHFFRHYNGYINTSHLRTHVPLTAIVPQFYGYYTPKKDGKGNQGQEPYLSPILLLEHCGEPIDPAKLRIEDQDECASLLLRFLKVGWLHQSIAPRNFLVQFGRPTEFPIKRQENPEPSFRLIDFGRSRMYKWHSDMCAEMMQVLWMFEKFNSGKRIAMPGM